MLINGVDELWIDGCVFKEMVRFTGFIIMIINFWGPSQNGRLEGGYTGR
jgi:hypothetical protein